MTMQAAASPNAARAFGAGPPFGASRVLAVTARPGQESADLGGVLFAFRRSGASLSLLCLTRGENTAGRDGSTRLEAARSWEVQRAAAILGVRQVSVASYRDGDLHHYRTADLAERIRQAAAEYSADLVLVVAPETGDIADAAVARAVTAAALQAAIPVAGRTRAGVAGSWPLNLGTDAAVARAIQKSAAAAHTTRAGALRALMRQLDELGTTESVRWLVSPARVPGQRDTPPLAR
jgi:LmbE family N-acetylglucosaminyl deacetylase